MKVEDMKVSANRIQKIQACLEESHVDTAVIARILDEGQLIPGTPNGTTRAVEAETVANTIRVACDVLGDVTFGARAGLTHRESDVLTAYIGRFCRTLRESIETTARFFRVVDPTLAYTLRVSDNVASIGFTWMDGHLARYHRYTEFLGFTALSRMRALTRTNFFPLEMQLPHNLSNSADKFRKLAGFPVTFGAESFEIFLPLSALDLPIPTYDPRLRDHLTEYGKRLLSEDRSEDPPLRSRIEGLLTASLPGNILSSDSAAAMLGMSPRTLARRLKEASTSYRAIVDDLRCDLAKTLMKDDMSLTEIAFALGYSDQAAFSTAFRRWTGEAPRDYATTHRFFQNGSPDVTPSPSRPGT